MSMFNTFGQESDAAGTKQSTARKLDRLTQALHPGEPDGVPISGFVWGGFTRRWRRTELPKTRNQFPQPTA